MKNKIALTLMALGLALPVTNLNAQDADQPPRPPRHEREEGRRPSPRPDRGPGGQTLFSAMDKNGDGVIDRKEFDDAIEALTRPGDHLPHRFAEERRRGPRDDYDRFERGERIERRERPERTERPPHPPGMERPEGPEHHFRDEDRPVPPRRMERERDEMRFERGGPEGRGPRFERMERFEHHGERPFGPMHPIAPLVRALDTNHDGVIDANEIGNASESLKKLDRNGDGEIRLNEIRGDHPGRFGFLRRKGTRGGDQPMDRPDGPRDGRPEAPAHPADKPDAGE